MASFSVDIRGDKELMAALNRLSTGVANRVVRKALREGAKLVQKKAKSLVPRDTGALAKSIKVRALKRSRRGFGVQVLTGTRSELGIPEDAGGYYPMAVEAGTARMPARPYLRPAFDSLEPTVTRTIKETVGREAEREWSKGRGG